MAFKWSTANSDQSPATIEVAKTSETAMAKGNVVSWDIPNNALERGTSTMTVHSMYGVCYQTRVAGDTTVVVVPFSPGQIWEADATNDSATAQVGERAVLTDSATLNNTSSDVTGDTGVFRILAPVGAAADRKLLVSPLGPIGVST